MYAHGPKDSKLTHLFIAVCGVAWPVFVAPFILPVMLRL